jgi:hypothetical protein
MRCLSVAAGLVTVCSIAQAKPSVTVARIGLAKQYFTGYGTGPGAPSATGVKLFIKPTGLPQGAKVLGAGVRANFKTRRYSGITKATGWHDVRFTPAALGHFTSYAPFLTRDNWHSTTASYVPFVDYKVGNKVKRAYGHPGNGEKNFYLGDATVRDVAKEHGKWVSKLGRLGRGIKTFNGTLTDAVPTSSVPHSSVHPGFTDALASAMR